MAKERILVTSTTEKSALEREDVILEVTEDLDMGNETVFLKAGSTIVFNGGMLKNVTDYMELLDKKVNNAFVGGNSVCASCINRPWSWNDSRAHFFNNCGKAVFGLDLL